jgi:hypothetical protein
MGRVVERLQMSGKKTVVAGALSLIMLFMWFRVFLGHRPAAAVPRPAPAASVSGSAPVKVKLVDLPKVPGRHDTIEREFFAIKDRTYLRRNPAGRDPGTDPEVPVVFSDGQEVIQRVGQKVKLEAVLWSENPQAFINDQLLRVGGKLSVKDGADVLELEVLQIGVDSVLVRCKGLQLTLELAPDFEVTK